MARLFIIFLFAASFSASAEIYRWVDQDGVVHFDDKKPDGNDVETMRLQPVQTFVSNQPANSAEKVVLLSAEWCGTCKVAKRYLENNDIPFTEYDIDKSSIGAREYQKVGANVVPVLLFNEEKMLGFSEQRFEQLYKK